MSNNTSGFSIQGLSAAQVDTIMHGLIKTINEAQTLVVSIQSQLQARDAALRAPKQADTGKPEGGNLNESPT